MIRGPRPRRRARAIYAMLAREPPSRRRARCPVRQPSRAARGTRGSARARTSATRSPGAPERKPGTQGAQRNANAPQTRTRFDAPLGRLEQAQQATVGRDGLGGGGADLRCTRRVGRRVTCSSRGRSGDWSLWSPGTSAGAGASSAGPLRSLRTSAGASNAGADASPGGVPI